MNLLAEAHRILHGVRFASPDDRVAVAERITTLATDQSLSLAQPHIHHTPAVTCGPTARRGCARKAEPSTPPRPLLDAEKRLLDTGRTTAGPAVSVATVAAVTEANLPGRAYGLSLDQAVAVEKIATSGRVLDVLVGPAGTGKSTTMAGLRAAWENRARPRLGGRPRPLGGRGRGARRRARDRHREHRQVAHRVAAHPRTGGQQSPSRPATRPPSPTPVGRSRQAEPAPSPNSTGRSSPAASIAASS